MKEELRKNHYEAIRLALKQPITNPAKPRIHMPKTLHLLIAVAVASILLYSISAQAQSDSQPTSFEFYLSGPAAGMRLWSRKGEMWTEKYSSGQKGSFRVKKAPYLLHGVTGTLVQKVDELDFYVFIPNIRSEKMEVWTYKGRGPWGFLAKMKEVTPGQFDY